MRKKLAVILAAVLTFNTLAIPAFAADEDFETFEIEAVADGEDGEEVAGESVDGYSEDADYEYVDASDDSESFAGADEAGYDEDDYAEEDFEDDFVGAEVEEGEEIIDIETDDVDLAAAAEGTGVPEGDEVASITFNKAGVETTYVYGTLQDAFDNAESGEKINLLKDVVVSESTTTLATLKTGKAVTLNLNGFTVENKGSAALFDVNATAAVLTIAGPGRIVGPLKTSTVLEETDGNMIIKDKVDVYGQLNAYISVLSGSFTNIAETNLDYTDADYGWVYDDNDQVYYVSTVDPVWAWTPAATASGNPSATIDLKLSDYTDMSVTGGAVAATSVSSKQTKAATSTAEGYDWYYAEFTYTGANYVTEDDFSTHEADTYTKADGYDYIVPGSEKEALGHKYSPNSGNNNVRFDTSAGKVLKDKDGNLKYIAGLYCSTDTSVDLTIYGAISKTVGGEVAATDVDGNAFTTVTTEVTSDATCLATGHYTYKFSIYDSADKAVVEGLTLEDLTEVAPKKDHDFTQTENNVTMVWLVDGIEVDVTDGSYNGRDLTEEDEITYLVYTQCTTSGCTEKTVSKEGTVTKTVTNPSVTVGSDGTITPVDGSLKFHANYTWNYTTATSSANRKAIDATKTYAIAAGNGESESTAYAPGTVTFADDQDYQVIKNSTCSENGIEFGTVKGSTQQRYQKLPLKAHTWKKIGTVAATTTVDGYDVYECQNEDSTGDKIHEDLLITFNGKTTSPVVDATQPSTWAGSDFSTKSIGWHVGTDGASDSIYKALGYTFTVAKAKNGKDNVVVLQNASDVIVGIAVEYLVTDNETKQAATVEPSACVAYLFGNSWSVAQGADVREALGLPRSTTPPYVYYVYNALSQDNPEALTCTEYAKITVEKDVLLNVSGSPRKYDNVSVGAVGYEHVLDHDIEGHTAASFKGQIHGEEEGFTGTVVWKENGAASVKIVCNDCDDEVATTGITVEAGEPVEPTCTTDGYTDYTATYTGELEGVVLVNPTYRGSIVATPGHDLDTDKVLVEKQEDGSYSAKIWCDTCEDYVDDVVESVEGPISYTDGTSRVEITYKNTNKSAVETTINRIIIDNAAVVLNGPDTYSYVRDTWMYGTLTDWSVNNTNYTLVESVTLENEKTVPVYGFAVTVLDSDGNIVEKPATVTAASKLDFGRYTAVLNGIGEYVGTIEVPFYVIEQSDVDYTMGYTFDGKTLTNDPSIVWDGNEHVIIATAYVEGKEPTTYKPGIVDENVAITYYVGDDEVDELVFSEAGEYEITVVSKKDNYEVQAHEIDLVIAKRSVGVAIDSATMVEGEVPELNYTLTATNFEGPVNEEEMGLEIYSTGGADWKDLAPGVYGLSFSASNQNYSPNGVGSRTATLTVIAKDGSTTEEQALASSVARQIDELNEESSPQDIAAVRAAYESLSDAAKARISKELVEKLDALEGPVVKAESKIEAAVAAVADENKTTDQKAAAIKEAQDAVDALTDVQKESIKDKIAELGKAAEALDAINAADKAIADAKKVTDDKNSTDAEKVAAAKAAQAAVDALPTNAKLNSDVAAANEAVQTAGASSQKALDNAKKAAEDAVAEAKAAAEKAQKDPSDANVKEAQDKVKAAEEAVKAAQGAGADIADVKKALDAVNDTTVKAAEANTAKNNNNAATLADFSAKVNALPDASKIKESDRAAVDAANALYAKLTDEQKKSDSVVQYKAKLDNNQNALDNPKITFGNSKVKTGKKTNVLKKGKKLKLKAKSSTGAKITYKTSKKKVATVSKKGVIKAKKKGKATITATCKNTVVKIKIKVK